MKDVLDLYEAHERDEARWVEKLPICDCCGEPMAEWYRIPQKFGDLLVCKECISYEEYEEEM